MTGFVGPPWLALVYTIELDDPLCPPLTPESSIPQKQFHRFERVGICTEINRALPVDLTNKNPTIHLSPRQSFGEQIRPSTNIPRK